MSFNNALTRSSTCIKSLIVLPSPTIVKGFLFFDCDIKFNYRTILTKTSNLGP